MLRHKENIRALVYYAEDVVLLLGVKSHVSILVSKMLQPNFLQKYWHDIGSLLFVYFGQWF